MTSKICSIAGGGTLKNLNSAEKIEWAAELIREFELHSKSGKGAFTFKGQMIDMPLVKQANNILQFA